MPFIRAHKRIGVLQGRSVNDRSDQLGVVSSGADDLRRFRKKE